MKLSNTIKYRLLITIGITILVAAIFVRPDFEYTVSIRNNTATDNRKSEFYCDINSDGNTERFMYYSPSPNTTSIIAYASGGGIIEQYNFKGNMVESANVFFTDYDNNGYREMCLFTHCADSLFLNIFEVPGKGPGFSASEFIDIAALQDGQAKYRITGGVTEDVDGDALSEIYFAVSAGFTVCPRNVYYYNPGKDAIHKSPDSGTGPRYTLDAGDIDGDGYIELWGQVAAFGNIKEPVPYTDQKAWLMVFSHELEFEFEPVGFAKFPAYITPGLYTKDNNKYLIVSLNYRGGDQEYTDRLMLYNAAGKKLKDVSAAELGLEQIENCFIINEKIFLHSPAQGCLTEVDGDFNPQRRVESELFNGYLYGPYNLGPGKKSILLTLVNNSLYFINNKGKQVSETVLTGSGALTCDPVLINNFNGFTGIQFKAGSYNYLLSITENNRWFLFTVKIISITVIVFLLVFLIQYIQSIQDKKKKAFENTLREYQLAAIKKQINPHFIFNALTSISAMNIKGETREADDYLVRFSGLMREVVESSDKNIVSLEEEIKFIKKYLELEKLRIGPELNFRINIPEECRSVKMPSMSLHLFVENAIKHGLEAKKGKKILSVEASSERDSVIIKIRDNGRGFSSGGKKQDSTGKGFRIADQVFSTYYHLTGTRIMYEKEEADTGGVIITLKISV